MSHVELRSLEKLRLKLLDLSGRNNLINFKHNVRKSLRVIDEIPDQIYSVLVSSAETKPLQFAALKEPKEKEVLKSGILKIINKDKPLDKQIDSVLWAEYLGISSSYILPKNSHEDTTKKHSDKHIQTLLFQEELEAVVRKIYQEANTFEEESGVNILYLAFGFLNWIDSSSKKDYVSPLLLIPVKIERVRSSSNGQYVYEVMYTGEDVEINISLREKLQKEYNIIIEDFDQNDETPEQYFNKIKSAIEFKEDWSVQRAITLSLFNFSKLQMYLDLDPTNWPNNFFITHPILSKFFDSSINTETEGSLLNNFAEEYDIDAMIDVHDNFPTVLRADSSQHSAIIDSAKGKSLVIEGPPGTGKSQTISNIIALAIGKGKKVLFVAEKLAALEVVKKNLDKVGLGDFCLELHSNKTNKLNVLDSIRNRMKRPRIIKPSIESAVMQFESYKSKLNLYSKILNSIFEDTGYTCIDILALSINLNKEYGEAFEHFIFTEHITSEYLEKIRRNTQNTTNLYSLLVGDFSTEGVFASHPWHGISSTSFGFEEDSNTINLTKDMYELLLSIVGLQKDIAEKINIPLSGEFAELFEFIKLCDLVISLNIQQETLIPVLRSNLSSEVSVFEFAQKICLKSEILLNKRVDINAIKKINASDILSRWNILISTSPRLKDYKRINDLCEIFYNFYPRIGNDFLELYKILNHAGVQFPQTGRLCICYIEKISVLFNLPFEIHEKKPDKSPTKISVYNDLLAELKSLSENYKKITSILTNSELPEKEFIKSIREKLVLGGFFGVLSSDWRFTRAKARSIFINSDKLSSSLLVNQIEVIEKFIIDKNKFETNLNYQDALGGLSISIFMDEKPVLQLRDWYQCIKKNKNDKSFADIIENLPTNSYCFISEYFKTNHKSISEIKNCIEGIENITGLEMTDQDLFYESDAVKQKSVFKNIFDSVLSVKAFTELAIPIEFHIDAFDILTEIKEFQEYIDQSNKTFGFLPNNPIKNIMESGCSALDIGEMVNLEKYIQGVSEFLKYFFLKDGSEKEIKVVSNSILTIKNVLDTFETKKKDFMNEIESDDYYWFGNNVFTIHQALQKFRNAYDNKDMLQYMKKYLYARAELPAQFFNMFTGVEKNEITPSRVMQYVNASIFTGMAQRVLISYPELYTSNRFSQEQLQVDLEKVDKELTELNKKVLTAGASGHIAPNGVRGQRVGDYTEMELINHELGKEKRHVSIRKLFKNAKISISALKPCFMMSPMSIPRFLDSTQEFDMIVMDEASQIRPEDAIGAIARGKQIIIVGDSKQLPPTNFFTATDEIENIEELSAAEISESILEVASPLFQPARRLRWHYRSRHESLIAFSNNSFYGGDLVVLPSPASENPEFGIKFHKVSGIFLKGRNSIEAKVVASAIKKHLENNKNESIGVVAMNKEQSDLIHEEFELLLRESLVLQNTYDANVQQFGAEKLFIKNLENVQGDERDVIIISCTYGPITVGERVPQRFGPINSPDGWRRLNVLFTRSRKRMHICSSMTSGDIVVEATSNRGIESLHNFLAYAETKNLTFAAINKEFGKVDSPFESAVVTALIDNGYLVETQVGVAGYSIDIAVRDPKNPGNFLLGIECDGATYHSQRSARDRDILRQKVLESLNWEIHRIWSTDWFKNSNNEIKIMLRRIEELQDMPKKDTDIVDPFY